MAIKVHLIESFACCHNFHHSTNGVNTFTNDNFISDLTSLQFAATVATVVNLSVTNELVTNRKYIYIVYIIYKKGKKVNTASVTSAV